MFINLHFTSKGNFQDIILATYTLLLVTNEILTPTVNRCNATFTFHSYAKNIDIYTYFGDATQLDEPFELWSNQQDFNNLDMTMEAIYDTYYNIPLLLPPLPDYVSSINLGIIGAKVRTRHTKLSGRLLLSFKRFFFHFSFAYYSYMID